MKMASHKSDKTKQSNEYLNIHVKKILDDIIDVAYSGESEENREKYKDFSIYITDKELRSKSGHYISNEHKIEIFNISLGSNVVVKVSIHELAHHIEYCKNKKCGHQDAFYTEFRKLLYAGLNMQLFTVEDVKKDRFHNDSNKVAKIVEEWIPNYIHYSTDSIVFYVKSSYYTEKLLKERGYEWNSAQRIWSRNVFMEEKEQEIEFLNSIHAEYDISEASSVHIQSVCYINAVATKPVEFEELKKQGFVFQKTNTKIVWKKKVDKKESSQEILKLKDTECLKNVNFYI